MIKISFKVFDNPPKNNCYLEGDLNSMEITFQLSEDAYRGTGANEDPKHYLTFAMSDEMAADLKHALIMYSRLKKEAAHV